MGGRVIKWGRFGAIKIRSEMIVNTPLLLFHGDFYGFNAFSCQENSGRMLWTGPVASSLLLKSNRDTLPSYLICQQLSAMLLPSAAFSDTMLKNEYFHDSLPSYLICQQLSAMLLPCRRISLVLLILVGFTASGDSSSDSSPSIYLSVCSKNPVPHPKDFVDNFVDAAEKITQNMRTSGFGTSSSGDTSTVFILGQCFSYLSPLNCQLCYSQSRATLPRCYPSTSGRIYLDGCFLEFSVRDVITDSVDAADAYACSNTSMEERLRPAFAKSSAELMGNLTAEAVRAADYSMVGSVVVGRNLTVYGMAECWRSLNVTGCKECLEKGRANIVGKCLPAGGGKAMNAGCFLSYSTMPFYAGGDRGDFSGKLRVIVAVPTVFVVLVTIGMVLWWKRRSASRWRNHDVGENFEIIRSIVKSHLSFKYEDLVKATDNFHQNNKLGQGGYGAVYKVWQPHNSETLIELLDPDLKANARMKML